MSIIQELENMKYRFVLDLLKKEEQYDKKRNVITAYDAHKMCYDRYLLMQEVLLPLKKKLGNRVEVMNINFVNSNDDEDGIVVKYLKDERQYFLSISNINNEIINVVASDPRLNSDIFIEDNRKIILDTFKDISNNLLDEEILVKSTTGKIVIRDNCDSFTMSDIDKKVFTFENKYATYDEKSGLNLLSSLTCNYSKLRELLMDEKNVLSLYQHIHIYEEDFPKTLTKKVN